MCADNILSSNDARDTARVNFTDGQWHMVALTTNQDGSKVRGLTCACLCLDNIGHASIRAAQNDALQ